MYPPVFPVETRLPPMIVNMPIFRNRWRLFIALTCLLATVFAPGLSGADSDPKRKSVSINVVDEPLNQVLGRISNASGYEIVFDEEWGNVQVSLSFENEPLDRALNRVLANLNHAVIWNEQERKISIFISGKAGSGRSTSSYSSGAPREGYPGVRVGSDLGSGSQSYQRTPSAGRQPEPFNRSETINERAESIPLQRAPGVSVSGGETRFEQATSTID